MENKKIKDERVVSQRRKIQSDAYSILVYFLLFSILFQQYILNAPTSQFAGEFVAVIVIGLYVAIRNISSGLDIFSHQFKSTKKLFLNSILLSTITVVFLYLSLERETL